MTWMNVDRHGLENLKADPAKPLDRVKIPPFLIYVLALLTIAGMMKAVDDDETLHFQTAVRRNVLKAMRRSEKQRELYAEDEISGGEKTERMSREFLREERRQERSRDSQRLIKHMVGGLSVQRYKTVDLQKEAERSAQEFARSSGKS